MTLTSYQREVTGGTRLKTTSMKYKLTFHPMIFIQEFYLVFSLVRPYVNHTALNVSSIVSTILNPALNGYV